MKQHDWIVYGSELSPFTLKLLAICRFLDLPHRFFPAQGTNLENVQIYLRKTRLVNGFAKLTYPDFTVQDEFPLVPFLFGPNGENLYDSSAIAHWLDNQQLTHIEDRLCPEKPLALAYAINLVDEYADEFGLYMVHHNRWKFSAKRNNAGHRLSQELPGAAAPIRGMVDRFFSARQTRRLPYLFSVAPKGYTVTGVISERQPPSRKGFPQTHTLLEKAFGNLLDALEAILARQPYLFGECFTLADASIYGQLGMNLTDPEANEWMQQQAPLTHAWLERIHHGDFSKHRQHGEVKISRHNKALLAEICRSFVPLMQQNRAAWLEFSEQGEKLFNEPAFDRGKCLYDGEIDGEAFRSVAKSFQVKVWQGLRNQWDALAVDERARLEKLLPENHGLDHS